MVRGMRPSECFSSSTSNVPRVSCLEFAIQEEPSDEDYLLVVAFLPVTEEETRRDIPGLPLSTRANSHTIANFGETESWHSQRFRTAQVERLSAAMDLPEEWQCLNGLVLRGERWLLVIYLLHLALLLLLLVLLLTESDSQTL